MVYNNILETIGNTPLVRLRKVEEKYKLNNRLFAKLESFNPTNSVKTRPALNMFISLLEKGLINKDTKIIESTSGNTGIALAMISAYFGNECILVMPDTLSKERISHMALYGAKIVLTPGSIGINGARIRAIELSEKYPNSVIPSQFDNPDNPASHYLTTANELLNDLDNIDYLFAGIGTGGTISGIGRHLKEKGLNTSVIGVEPYNSSVINGFVKGKHKIQGIGAGFIPENLDLDMVDQVLRVKSDEAIQLTKELPRLEGISAGVSSGAVLKATIDFIKEKEISYKDIVMIFPDDANKYFSLEIFD